MSTASHPSTIRVVRCDGAWRVIFDPTRERLIDTLCTRERAVHHALELAGDLVRAGDVVRVRVEDGFEALEEIHVVH